MNNNLKYRMYFFVPYNLSEIQKAIQAGHAALEYAYNQNNYKSHEFIDFMENDRTWIILNGGTTNSKTLKLDENFHNIPIGTLDQILRDLTLNKIRRAYFQEPDLNDAVTAVCFLADERVWDYENYPEFYDWCVVQRMYPYVGERVNKSISVDSNHNIEFLRKSTPEYQKESFPKEYKMWIDEVLGEEKNEFLRNLIRGKKLA